MRKFFLGQIFVFLFGQTVPMSSFANVNCVMKTDYDSQISCSLNTIVASNQAELDQYSIDFGLQNGQFSKLKVNFDVTGSDIQIHSPCQITIAANVTVTGDNICFDGRLGIQNTNGWNANGGSITLLSQFEGAEFGQGSSVSGNSLTIRAFKTAKIGNNSNLEIEGDIELESLGDAAASNALIKGSSVVIANNIKLMAVKTAHVEDGSTINASSTVSIISSGDFTTSDALVDQNSIITAKRVSLSASRAARIGNHNILNASELVEIISTGSYSGSVALIKAHSVVNAGNLLIASGNKGTIKNDVVLSIGNHFHMESVQCSIDQSVSITSNSLTGSCFNNPNDLPVPGADQLDLRTGTNVPINFTLNAGTDADGDFLTYLIVTGPSNGVMSGCLDGSSSLCCTYTPNLNFSGIDTITYIARDGIYNGIVTATIQIAVNLPPVMVGNQSFVTNEDTQVSFSLSGAIDPENDSLTYEIVTPPNSGELLNCLENTSDLDCDFLPSPDFNGQITFTYKANDGFNDSTSVSTVTINVIPVNDAPVMLNDENFSTDEDTPLIFVLAGAFDVDGDFLTYFLTSYPEHGRLENCVRGNNVLTCTYIPEENFSGQVTFAYKANDGFLDSINASTITISINPINDPPYVVKDQIFNIQKGVPGVITLSGAIDVDSSNLTYRLISPPSFGTLSNCLEDNDDLICDYNPGDTNSGVVTFSYIASDGVSDSVPQTVTIFVNVPPVALIASNAVNGVAPLAVSVNSLGSHDVDGYIVKSSWNFGDGTITFGEETEKIFETPGIYNIQLAVVDNNGGSATDIIQIFVSAPNQPPVASFIADVTSGPPPLTVSFTSNSTDDQGIASFNWDFGGLGSSTDSNAQFTFPIGPHRVSLTVTDTLGLQSTVEHYIYVEDPPCNGAPGENHANGGGFVANSAIVELSVFVEANVEVCNFAEVSENVELHGKVRVSGNAKVFGNAILNGPLREEAGFLSVRDDVEVFENAVLSGRVQIFENGIVHGRSRVYGEAQVFGEAEIINSEIFDRAKVYGSAVVLGSGALVDDNDNVNGTIIPGNVIGIDSKGRGESKIARLKGSKVFGDAEVFDRAEVFDDSEISGTAKIYGNARVEDSIVQGTAEIFDYSIVKSGEVYKTFILGDARVYGNALIEGSVLYGFAKVFDTAKVIANGTIPSVVFGNGVIRQFSTVKGSQVYEDAEVFGFAKIENQSKIHGNAQVDYDVDGLDISTKLDSL